MSDSLWRWPAHQLADAIRHGAVSAREATRAALERVHAVNPALNAIVDLMADEALAAADAADAFALHYARLIDSWAQAVLGQSPGLARRDAHDTLRHLERAQSRSSSGFLQVEERAALDLVMQIAIASGDDDLLAQALAVATRSGIAQATALRGERLAAETPEFAEALVRGVERHGGGRREAHGADVPRVARPA